MHKKTKTAQSAWSWFQIKGRFSVLSDCLLGPPEEELRKDGELEGVDPLHMPPTLSCSHPNAFHVWDQDDIIIPMSPPHESPAASPLMSVIPYIPSFFPHPISISSPPHNQPLPTESVAWGHKWNISSSSSFCIKNNLLEKYEMNKY